MTELPQRDAHASAHPDGYTIVVYLPPEAPGAKVQETFDRIEDVWATVQGDEGGGWDAFMVGRGGDPMGIDADRPAATPCSQPNPCEDGEPCDVHEVERAHAEGEHELCGVTCAAQYPTEELRNFILHRALPGSPAMLDELLRRAALNTLADSPAATDAELAIRQRYAWHAAGRCPRCGSSGTDGWLCASCTAAMRAGERRIWRRWTRPFRGAPIQGPGYTPAQLLGDAPQDDR